MSAGVVVWNGAKDGPNRGYLCIDAATTDVPAPLRRRVVQGELAEQILAALEAEPEGVLCHELAQLLGVDTYRVNGVLYHLLQAGFVRAERLARPVWTGHRFATYRYVWQGRGA